MSSALAMILMAAMAVPGDGPAAMEERLDLSGRWVGSLDIEPGFTPPASYQDGKLTVIRPDGPYSATLEFVDQGDGKCRCRCAGVEALVVQRGFR